MKNIHHIIRAGLWMLMAVWVSCGPAADRTESGADERKEDVEAKRRLQGIWRDKETETVAFYVKGDTIYYPDTAVVPVHFYIAEDTLFLGNKPPKAYPIDRMGPSLFRFHSATGEVVTMERSEDPNDTICFTHRQAVPLTYNEVVKNDTVVYYDAVRYHCYVYVNPSRIKVYKTSYTNEGMAVDNVYYDNVIHIAVYQGKTCLFSKDYNRRSFTGMVPEDFLSRAILSNMTFDRVDGQGFHFNATVCIPDDASCYMVRICANHRGKENMELIEY